MKLYLLRHGQAEPGLPLDADRSLTPYGIAQVQASAGWLAQRLNTDDRVSVWASPYRRTQQSAEVVSQSLGCDLTTVSALTPDARPERMLEALCPKTTTLVLVTHLPLIGHLASLLIDGLGAPYGQGVFWSTAEVRELSGDVFASGCLLETARYDATVSVK